MPGGRKAVKSKNEESLVFSRGGVTEVTPYSPRKSGLLIFSCFTGIARKLRFLSFFTKTTKNTA